MQPNRPSFAPSRLGVNHHSPDHPAYAVRLAAEDAGDRKRSPPAQAWKPLSDVWIIIVRKKGDERKTGVGTLRTS